MNEYTYKPVKFFALTTSITWVTWSLAAYFSYQTGKEPIQMLLTIAGSVAPSVVGLFMIYGSGSRALKQDFLSRLLQINRVGFRYLLTTLLLFPASWSDSRQHSPIRHVSSPRPHLSLGNGFSTSLSTEKPGEFLSYTTAFMFPYRLPTA